MKKGTSWKRVFVHTDGRTLDNAVRVLEADQVETYVRQVPIWGTGTLRTRKYETHVFVPRHEIQKANSVLVANDFVF